MIYQIDQSGKIEDTNKLTVVAYAGNKVKSITISSSEKQKLMNTMRSYDHPGKVFIFKAFAGLVYLLLKDDLKAPEIDFTFIGKDSPAHKAALEVYRGFKKPDKKVSAKDILELFYSKKKGWSPHSR